MTEKMAVKKFAKTLEPTTTGPFGDYRFLFWVLRKTDGYTFHHQPKTVFHDGPTKNSLYFWYPDLEDAALARGWKPRGKKKDEVPWTRKDYPSTLATPSTPPKTKKRKTAAKVTPDRK